MTATARPQHVVDAAETAVAGHRATVGELLTAYRDTTARLGDPLAAYAGVAGAAYQSMCSREATRVLAAAVQMLSEARDAAELMPFPVEPLHASDLAAIAHVEALGPIAEVYVPFEDDGAEVTR